MATSPVAIPSTPRGWSGHFTVHSPAVKSRTPYIVAHGTLPGRPSSATVRTPADHNNVRCRMQIGVHVPTTVAPGVTRDALLTFAREAEARNFASLWVSDHIVIPKTTDADYPGGGRRFPIPPETPYLEPVAMLSALAVLTTKA